MKLSELINQYNGVTPQEQPQEGIQPTPQPTTQPTQKPIYTSKGDGVTSEHGAKTTTKTQSLAPWTDIPHVDVPDATYNAPDVSKIHNTGMYDLIKSYQRPTYEEDMQRAKRQQTAGMISDLAGLFAKGIGLSKGQRIFPQTKSSLDAANQNVENVRQLQRQSREAYNQQLLNASAQDYQQDKIDKRNALMNAYNLYKAGLDSKDKALDRNIAIDKTNAEGKGRVLTRQQTQQKIDNDKEYHRNTLELQKDRNNISRENGALNRAIALRKLQIKEAKVRATSGGGGSGTSTKDWDSIWLNEGGKMAEWYFPKVSKGSVAGLYQQMKTKYPKEVQDLESTTISLGGDKQNDRLAVVKQMMQKHPELTNMFTHIQGVRRASSFYPQQTAQKPAQRPNQPTQRPTQQPAQRAEHKPTIKKGWGANINKWK